MASYTTDQKVFVAKTVNFSGGSCVAVERKYGREFFVGVAPSRDNIYKFVKEFEETESLCDKGGRHVNIEHLFVRKKL
jgi:hypothetical protein